MDHESRGVRMRRVGLVSLSSVALALIVLGACEEEPSVPATAPEPTEAPTEPEAPAEAATADTCVASALAATKALEMGLKTRLVAAMQEGAPAAVDVCANEAETIRARVASETGVRVGRTSTKLRNPSNAEAPQWAKAYLDSPTRDGDGYAPWVERTDAEAHVVSPLVAQGLCLTCHGEAIPAEVMAAIDAAYPDDHARGFAEGDLRGVVWASASCE